MAKILPAGRGMYIWVLARTEHGDINKIIAKCKECNITWLAIKAGDQGNSWMPTLKKKPQFSADIVKRFHDAGIKVYGWSYDVPAAYKTKDGQIIKRNGVLEAQANIVKKVQECGADGFIIDAEVEWDRALDPDAQATEYMQLIGQKVKSLTDFAIGDAPWPIVQYHPTFPFTAFGLYVDFRCPQVYWTAQKLDKNHEVAGPVDDSWERYRLSWASYERWVAEKRIPVAPHAIKPHFPAGSAWDNGNTLVQSYEINYFEGHAREEGMQGVLYWVWELVPQRIWDGLKLSAAF